MNKDYLQNIRYKLQKRVAYLKSCKSQMFLYLLKRFWRFLENEPILNGVIENLKIKYSEISNAANVYLDVNAKSITIYNTEEENAALCAFILIKLIEKENVNYDITSRIGWKFIGKIDFPEGYDAFNDFIIDPFYEYLDESLDDNKAILSYLLKYKLSSEWFHNDRLFELWKSHSQIGETLLAKDLYEYLFDQGLDFYIESKSEVGRVDLVESQVGENRLLADVKIFNKDIGYISKGFNQVYTYTQTYNQPVGYMIIFKTCEEDLKFSLKNQDSQFNYIAINNKTIFFLTIDIFKYNRTASQRGVLKSYEITEEVLIKAVSENINI